MNPVIVYLLGIPVGIFVAVLISIAGKDEVPVKDTSFVIVAGLLWPILIAWLLLALLGAVSEMAVLAWRSLRGTKP